MSRLTIVDQRLCLRFSRAEKVMGILRDLEVPVECRASRCRPTVRGRTNE